MNNREIERKFVVDEEVGYGHALAYLSDIANLDITAVSYDLYWKAPGVDFVRLRENNRELTVKVTDKDTIVDRIEENVTVEKQDMEACARLQTLLFGEPFKLKKRFSVLLPDIYRKNKSVICLYTVEGDPFNRLFLEVEAESLKVVDAVITQIPAFLRYKLVPETRSLYQIFSEVTK